MARPPRTSPFDRRLQELEAESSRVRKELRHLSRTLQSGAPAPALVLPPRKAEPRPVPAEREPPPSAGATPRPRPGFLSADAPAAAPPAGGVEPSPSPTPLPEPRRVEEEPKRLSSYLSSGSFGSTRPVADERRFQRNKALFMLAFVGVLALILYALFFR
jgi:hypothetical protein